MRAWILFSLAFVIALGMLTLSHAAFLHLPYFWDEAGYYIPAALDFYHHGLLIPRDTLPTGHTPLVPIYLALAWRLFGFSQPVTRVAMLALAAGTLIVLYALGRTVARREVAAWSCILLALCPLFFMQSMLAHLDLAAALTTTLAVLALIKRRMGWFALAASISIMTKETAVILLPVAWLFAWRIRKGLNKRALLWLAIPLLPLIAWTFYYHRVTGFWTGNPTYLRYNLYSTLRPLRIFISFARRLYQVFIEAFNWLLVGAAVLGYRRMKKARASAPVDSPHASRVEPQLEARQDFYFLTCGLLMAYVVMLSLVGGALLPRYLLPVFPCFYLALVMFADFMPQKTMRGALAITAICFIAGWFINPPYPFPYEDNLACVDFIRLHQQAAGFLSSHANNARILTAWPASDELTRPALGYVPQPLQVVPLPTFREDNFQGISPDSFDLLYFYSRGWSAPDNWLRRHPQLDRIFDYTPAIPASELEQIFHLKLIAAFHERGQWVKIYSK